MAEQIIGNQSTPERAQLLLDSLPLSHELAKLSGEAFLLGLELALFGPRSVLEIARVAEDLVDFVHAGFGGVDLVGQPLAFGR